MTTPTVYEWAGGAAAFRRLTEVFYDKVLEDPVLAPVFAHMSDSIASTWRSGWARCSAVRRATPTNSAATRAMLAHHLGLGLTEEQRSRWAALIAASADPAGLPDDPEFRSAFVAYVEWGTRIALANSQPGATPPPEAPVPALGLGRGSAVPAVDRTTGGFGW